MKKVEFWESWLAREIEAGRLSIPINQAGLEMTTPDGRSCWRRTDEISTEEAKKLRRNERENERQASSAVQLSSFSVAKCMHALRSLICETSIDDKDAK